MNSYSIKLFCILLLTVYACSPDDSKGPGGESFNGLRHPRILLLEGEGFMLDMKYNTKVVSPVIEFNEVVDTSLKRYWPNGITRIVLNIKSGVPVGKNQIEITKVR